MRQLGLSAPVTTTPVSKVTLVIPSDPNTSDPNYPDPSFPGLGTLTPITLTLNQ